MTLSDLLEGISHRLLQGSKDVQISRIVYDSRQVTPHSLFIALTGNRVDGHQYIADAFNRGASAVIVEHSVELLGPHTIIEVEDTRMALAEFASRFYGYPADDLKLIGITGTNGKTSVSFLVRHLLQQAGHRCGLIGTVEYDLGNRIIPAMRTTPESPEIHEYLAAMVKEGCIYGVMEVSSHALLQHRVHGLKFDTVAFTNLTQDHLDYHGSMGNYFNAKRRLFELHAKGGKIVNGDDQFGDQLAQEYASTTVGERESAQLRIEVVELDQSGSRFRIDDTQFQMPLIGRHNVENAAMAIAIVQQVAGISLDQSAEGLIKARPVPGRLEAIEENQPFGVYVDYAHTDDALSNVLEALREITPGKLQVVFGCGGNRDSGKRNKMGKVASELADVVTITTDNPRREDPAIIAQQIAEGCSSVRQEGWRIELDRARAIDEVLRSARSGDTVLVAGKGHETYQEVNDSVIPFDDSEQIRAILANLGFER